MKVTMSAQKAALVAIDQWLDYQARQTNFPGYQVCIRHGVAVIFSKAYGFADKNNQHNLTTKHLFRVASHSKTFTACATLQLVEQGTLSLDEKLIDWLPEFKKHKDRRFRDITLRDLLTHRSGIFRDGVDALFWEHEQSFFSKERLINEVMGNNLIYSPNTRTKYSNIGTSLLGLVLEMATQKTFAQIIQEQIISKLTDQNIYPDYTPSLAKRVAQGWSRDIFNGKRQPVSHSSTAAAAPATGLCGTAESISGFFYEFLYGHKLLGGDWQRRLFSDLWPVENVPQAAYGYCLQYNIANNNHYIGHSGGFLGFTTQTRAIIGTDYVISFFMPTVSTGFGILQNIYEIIAKAIETFGTSQIVEASPVLINGWVTSQYLIGKDKTLHFPVNTWSPVNESEVFDKTKTGFISHKQNGYTWMGEELRFARNKPGRIIGSRIGGEPAWTEAAFYKKHK